MRAYRASTDSGIRRRFSIVLLRRDGRIRSQTTGERHGRHRLAGRFVFRTERRSVAVAYERRRAELRRSGDARESSQMEGSGIFQTFRRQFGNLRGSSAFGKGRRRGDARVRFRCRPAARIIPPRFRYRGRTALGRSFRRWKSIRRNGRTFDFQFRCQSREAGVPKSARTVFDNDHPHFPFRKIL